MDPKSKFIPSPQNSAPGPYLHSTESVTYITRRYRIKATALVDQGLLIIKDSRSHWDTQNCR